MKNEETLLAPIKLFDENDFPEVKAKKQKKEKKLKQDDFVEFLNDFQPIKEEDHQAKVISAPNIIVSDFRSEFGEVADVISFQKEFLGRSLSKLQEDTYLAAWGPKGGEWSTQYSQIVLLVGMKGGKNFWIEGDVAYLAYFISMLRDPHDYFTKITKRPMPYQLSCSFDVPFVTSVSEAQTRFVTFNGIQKVLKRTMDPKTKSDNWFEKHIGLDLRETFGDITRNEIVFPERKKTSGIGGLRLFGYNSNPSAAEGLHMIRFYADELSRATTKASYKVAKDVISLGTYNTLASFPNRVGKVIQVSYPNSTQFDVTNEEYENSKSLDFIYGLKAATYEFNPTITKDMLNTVDQESAEFKLKYECIKPERKIRNIKGGVL